MIKPTSCLNNYIFVFAAGSHVYWESASLHELLPGDHVYLDWRNIDDRHAIVDSVDVSAGTLVCLQYGGEW